MGGSFDSNLFHGTNGSPQHVFVFEDEQAKWVDVELSVPVEAPSAITVREKYMSEASTDQVKAIVNELYRKGSGVGDGGTADAIRHELATGERVGGRSHIGKGKERLRQIERILKRNPEHPDAALLDRLAKDLRKAIGGN